MEKKLKVSVDFTLNTEERSKVEEHGPTLAQMLSPSMSSHPPQK